MAENELTITTLDIQNEMDVMLAHRRAMQFAKFSGIGLSEQTRFATAVSEICRNILEYAVSGSIKFSIVKDAVSGSMIATIADEGKGIKNLTAILERKPETHKGRGLGIVYAQRLSDNFKITSSAKGTLVIIQKNISGKDTPLNKLIIQGWLRHLANEPVISAYEELKMRNIQLVQLTEELTMNNRVVETQIEEIKKLNERLSASNERMKEFTYALSHDLKTPLTSLKLSSDFIEQNPDSPDASMYKQIHSRSINRINKTIHSLIEILDYQHRDKQAVKELQFEKIFHEAREEYEHFINDAKAEIKFDFTIVPTVMYMEAHLQSIFHNLLSNSLKYRNTKRQLKINIATGRSGKKIVLSFSDNGVGMDLDKIGSRLFVPFNRFSEQPDGKGIGLYLIKSMVESNGGSVVVESMPGKGTKFIFHLISY